MPRVRDGSSFPSLLDPRRRAERALLDVVCEAYVSGVSNWLADELVRSLGISGISRSAVSRMRTASHAEVAAFRIRSLAPFALAARGATPCAGGLTGPLPGPAF